MSLDVLVADLLVDELLEEDVLGGGDGLKLIAEIVDESGGVVLGRRCRRGSAWARRAGA